ncbi:unnamed protein product [Vitrella brassicaformis CCMP3155]|uniref:Uncharacterized protein n=1 Tax=Vitrella brassicaformis (strain CCMP3155) TaxID=1169540 RepID=A0A0G4F1N2_VITBC|nr:unnamed protein product [Vitrella brassicaformis CCMP3155]|eukprot:CEM05388.1 unnamed protein product [Vitrella brassicaformis CCMP3155]
MVNQMPIEAEERVMRPRDGLKEEEGTALSEAIRHAVRAAKPTPAQCMVVCVLIVEAAIVACSLKMKEERKHYSTPAPAGSAFVVSSTAPPAPAARE